MVFNLKEYEEKRERERQEDRERQEKRRAEIAALTTDLERILTTPSRQLTALERQSDLLDCLLYTIMRGNLDEDKKAGYFSEDRLNLALRIQKQCIDTMKAAGTVAYMQSIATAQSGVWPSPLLARSPEMALPPPPPPQNDEQT